jgi:hypothetical protein
MKSNVSKCLALGAMLLLAVSAFASNKGSLTVPDAFTVNGKQLAAGEYTVKWEGSGPNVELSIEQRGKVVASAPAHLVDLNKSADTSSAIVRTNSDGSRALSEIRFGGKKYALAISDESASAK